VIELDETLTLRFPALRSGKPEVMEATSVDGGWHFRRLEESGAPWLVVHDDFPGWSMLAASLEVAQETAERQLHLDVTVGLEARAR
jgi:hypothetical protein